jgi:hypothetical protein
MPADSAAAAAPAHSERGTAGSPPELSGDFASAQDAKPADSKKGPPGAPARQEIPAQPPGSEDVPAADARPGRSGSKPIDPLPGSATPDRPKPPGQLETPPVPSEGIGLAAKPDRVAPMQPLSIPKDVEPALTRLPIPELDPTHTPSDPAAALKALDKLKKLVGTHKP